MIKKIKINKFECGLLKYFNIINYTTPIKSNLDYSVILYGINIKEILDDNNTIILSKNNTEINNFFKKHNSEHKKCINRDINSKNIEISIKEDIYECFYLIKLETYDELKSLDKLLSDYNITILTLLRKDIK